MIAFLECFDIPGRKHPAFLAERVFFLDLPAIKISVWSRTSKTGKRVLKSLERAKDFLREARVKNIIFSDSFPYSKFFLDRGFINISTADLMYIATQRLIERYSDREGRAAVIARELDGRCRNILAALCRKNRFVLADIGRGAVAEIERLRRETGISIITRPSKEQLLGANLAVILSKPWYRAEFSDSCAVIASDNSFWECVSCRRPVSAADFGLSPENEAKILNGFSRQAQIAAAVSCFALRPEDIIRIKVTEGDLTKKCF